MLRSEWTWKPGVDARVERKDFTLRCHFPPSFPYEEAVNESSARAEGTNYLVISLDILCDVVEASCWSVRPSCKPASKLCTSALDRATSYVFHTL